MTDKERLENKPNWVLTVKRLNPSVRERYDCLMATLRGDAFFWYTPDYQGLFASGATHNFSLSSLRWAIENRHVCIIKASSGALKRIGLRK